MLYITSLSFVLCLLLLVLVHDSYTQAFTFIQTSRSKISSSSNSRYAKLKATNNKDDEDISSPFFFASVSDGSNSTNSALVGAGVVGTTAVVLSEGNEHHMILLWFAYYVFAYCLFYMIYMINF